MSNDKQVKFLDKMSNLKLEPKEFIEQICLFSQYLVYSNQDYLYNETYLENFGMEFINFKKYVEIKKEIFGNLVKNMVNCPQDIELEICVDQFWVYSSIDAGISVSKNMDGSKVCREETIINGSLIYENKRRLFLKEYKVISCGKLLKKSVAQIYGELLQWVEDIYNGEEKE